MTKSDLKKLKQKLGKNYLQLLSERTGMARSTVFHVMRGDWQNEEIVDTAFIILEERRSKEEQQKNLLAS